MPMRVKMDGVIGEIIKPYGKFEYGDVVEVTKIKISKYDYSKSKVCISDGQQCYWIDICNIRLMPANCDC